MLAVLAFSLTACVAAPSANPSEASTSSAVEPEPTSTAGPSAVITIAGVDVDGQHLTVAGYVTSIVEDGGACEFTLTSGISGNKVTVDSTGSGNVMTTSCGTSQIPIGQVTRGPWDVVLHYSSSKTNVTSASVHLEVP